MRVNYLKPIQLPFETSARCVCVVNAGERRLLPTLNYVGGSTFVGDAKTCKACLIKV